MLPYMAPDWGPSSRNLELLCLTNMLRDFEHYSVKQLEHSWKSPCYSQKTALWTSELCWFALHSLEWITRCNLKVGLSSEFEYCILKQICISFFMKWDCEEAQRSPLWSSVPCCERVRWKPHWVKLWWSCCRKLIRDDVTLRPVNPCRSSFLSSVASFERLFPSAVDALVLHCYFLLLVPDYAAGTSAERKVFLFFLYHEL